MSQSNSEGEKFERSTHYRHTPSLFGPIILIALGVGFLLANLGLLPAINWAIVARLWPLFLILWGVNLLARQAPRPWGALLSALVGLAAVAGFVYLIFFGASLPWVQNLSSPTQVVRQQTLTFAPEGVDSADIELHFDRFASELTPLDAGDPNLIKGVVSYVGDLTFETEQSGSDARVDLSTHSQDWWFLNPANWTTFTDRDKWRLELARDVTLDLTLVGGSGSLFVDLTGLTVEKLDVNGSSGSLSLTLAEGNYDSAIEGGSGSMNITLPARGRPDIKLQGGSGSVTLRLPTTTEARVVVERGSGSFSANGRLERVQEGDQEIWETAGYAGATNRILLTLDGGSGSLTVSAP